MFFNFSLNSTLFSSWATLKMKFIAFNMISGGTVLIHSDKFLLPRKYMKGFTMQLLGSLRITMADLSFIKYLLNVLPKVQCLLVGQIFKTVIINIYYVTGNFSLFHLD